MKFVVTVFAPTPFLHIQEGYFETSSHGLEVFYTFAYTNWPHCNVREYHAPVHWSILINY